MMIKSLRYLTLLFALNLCQMAYSQYLDPKGSLYVETTIPTNEKNVAFASTMEGLFHGGIGYQRSIWKGFNGWTWCELFFFQN